MSARRLSPRTYAHLADQRTLYTVIRFPIWIYCDDTQRQRHTIPAAISVRTENYIFRPQIFGRPRAKKPTPPYRDTTTTRKTRSRSYRICTLVNFNDRKGMRGYWHNLHIEENAILSLRGARDDISLRSESIYSYTVSIPIPICCGQSSVECIRRYKVTFWTRCADSLIRSPWILAISQKIYVRLRRDKCNAD